MPKKNILLSPLPLALVAVLTQACTSSSPPLKENVPGQTRFESEVGIDSLYGTGGTSNVAPTGEAAKDSGNRTPGGRMAEVEEADIYRIDGDRLFYLNTYRGFMIYDVRDPQNPVRVSRLPVHGYPIEMFVQGNTVYALLRDALYLTQEAGALRFNRHNVSQLVSIDVTNPANPRVNQILDIVGELREGVSRKIENTIYVVSYIPQHYYWGWYYGPQQPQQQKEQAWVYSFNVANPQSMREVERLQIFEGGSVQFNDPQAGVSLSRHFQDIAISATSNALMVVENWWISTAQRGDSTTTDGTSMTQPGAPQPSTGCGSYTSNQLARVSIIDVSDPSGDIRIHTQFDTNGRIDDQFKMTYVHDARANTGTFFGIFARQIWSSTNCQGENVLRNTIESWDVTNGARPTKLHSLDFGKPNETVFGSAFDTERQVAFAITAQRTDPLYAIDISNRNLLRVRSEIDGLSGNMNVFRLVGNRQFLIGIGTDQSQACAGFQDTNEWRPTNVAVSLIDVRNLDAIRLVQRACVAVKNAEWVGSAVNWNLDQAHKMIGMHASGDTNVLTVPVFYYRRADDTAQNWWWYQQETAVGLMAWDLSRYNDTLPPHAQNVIQNYGTVIHPNGEVRRSIVFTHSSGRRMMINLSDTHLATVDIQDLARPQTQSVVEIAPYKSQIFGYGTHIVEHTQSSSDIRTGSTGVSEFRVKVAGGDLEDAPAVASFRISGVTRVIKHGSLLVAFRSSPWQENRVPEHEAVVVDLTNPAVPRFAGRTPIPPTMFPHYYFWCGGYDGGYWFGSDHNWVSTQAGIVVLAQDWIEQERQSVAKLLFLDLRIPSMPRVVEQRLGQTAYDVTGLTSDPADASAFYLNYYQRVGTVTRGTGIFQRLRYYTQRYTLGATGYTPETALNIPGQLVRTWKNPAGTRLFLTQDYSYAEVANPRMGNGEPATIWKTRTRLNLLREIGSGAGALAELRDAHTFVDLYLKDLVPNGDLLYVNSSPRGFWWGRGWAEHVAVGGIAQTTTDYSDRLTIFNLSRLSFDTVYDQSTGTTGVQLMGFHAGQLFMSIAGDGILAIDVSNPAAPVGRQFLRTLGYATHVEFAGQNAYVAAGHFGIFQMPIVGAPLLARR